MHGTSVPPCSRKTACIPGTNMLLWKKSNGDCLVEYIATVVGILGVVMFAVCYQHKKKNR